MKTFNLDLPEDQQPKTDFAAAFLAGQDSQGITLADGEAIALPAGREVHDLEKYAFRPRRIVEEHKAATLAGFIAYYNRFADVDSVVLVNPETGKFVGRIAYHEARVTMFSGDGDDPIRANLPRWNDHAVVFTPKHSPDWTDWKKQDKGFLSQLDFAEFIEDHLECIQKPEGSRVLEAVESLRATKKVEFGSGVNRHNGDLVLSYKSETTQGNGEVTLPETMQLAIEPFIGLMRYPIEAQLRYRIKDGQLTLGYKLIRADRVLDAAVQDMIAMVRGTYEAQGNELVPPAAIGGDDRVFETEI